MRLNVYALSVTAAVFWGIAILVVAIANALWPPYGNGFLALIASIYPGYHPTPTAGSIVTATLYGMVDGGIGAALFAWLYNLLSRPRPDAA